MNLCFGDEDDLFCLLFVLRTWFVPAASFACCLLVFVLLFYFILVSWCVVFVFGFCLNVDRWMFWFWFYKDIHIVKCIGAVLLTFLEVDNGWLLCSHRVLEASKTEDKTLELAFLRLDTFST